MKMHTTITQPLITPTTTIDNQQQPPLLHHDDDDSLSLRDLPIVNPNTTSTTAANTSASRRSSTSDPTSDFFFEFLINNDDHLITSTADDVILHGRLLPFAPPPPRRSLSLSSAAARLTRSQLTESSSHPAIRPSRSLNYRKLHRSPHHHNRSKPNPPKPKPKPTADIFYSHRCNFNSDKAPAKFSWYWLAFGLPVKMAAEMELKDIKNRQFRRNYAPPPAASVFSGDRCFSTPASWKFLSVLSCKSHATVDVNNTAPLRTSLM